MGLSWIDGIEWDAGALVERELVLVPEDPNFVLYVSVATEPVCWQLLCLRAVSVSWGIDDAGVIK